MFDIILLQNEYKKVKNENNINEDFESGKKQII